MKIADIKGATLGSRAAVFAAYLDSLPSDEVIYTEDLEAATGRCYRKQAQLPAAYSLLVSHGKGVRRIFGNPKAINSLRNKLSNENRTCG